MSSADPNGAAPVAAGSGVEDQAYEPNYIDYAEAFPPLAANSGGGFGAIKGPAPVFKAPEVITPVPNQWNNKMSLRSSTITQVSYVLIIALLMSVLFYTCRYIFQGRVLLILAILNLF